MALIPFWTWAFHAVFGIQLPYGWSWTLSQVTLIVIFQLLLALSVAVFILADRKIWAAVQLRRGPNVVGAFGMLQTIADALKFFFKEVIIPAGANKVFVLSWRRSLPRRSPLRPGPSCRSTRAGWSPTSMSASCTSSRSRRWAFMA